jgi:hypothetical protein
MPVGEKPEAFGEQLGKNGALIVGNDDEYRREGTANLFIFFAPLQNWRYS